MIRYLDGLFVLDTANTTYAFKILPTGQPEHIYYGRRIRIEGASDADILVEKHAFVPGNTNVYDKEHMQYSLEDMRLEFSSYGKGDIREPFVEIIHHDGGRTCDFVYSDYVINSRKTALKALPGAYMAGIGEKTDVALSRTAEGNDNSKTVTREQAETGEEAEKAEKTEKTVTGYDPVELVVIYTDKFYGLVLKLYYDVFYDTDVITRRSVLTNDSGETVDIERLMSMQIDFNRDDLVMTTFTGAWAREMKREDISLKRGKFINSSFTGTSSSRANPFVMLSGSTTDEDKGDCYGFNLIYSGNHFEAAEVSPYGKTRFVNGINPAGFSWKLAPGESFESPEAFFTYSHNGFNGMSRNMHEFIRRHIVRGEWKDRIRPVLINSWEANYFNISERKLLSLAKAAKDVGIELFVMDDGWFGHRNDDTSSLGDWFVNKDKLPGGLKGLCDKIKALGLDFGIWVEPEMTNVDSLFYQAHPDLTLEIPGKDHSEGRNQRILDLTKEEVQDYIIDSMTTVFSSADISYVKWDMNRTFTDVFSQGMPAEHQGEVFHRYVLGLYRVMGELIKRFPHILFEGCAAGGNRFDAGILCYFPQIWASDDTDALCRSKIQTGYSYGYPMSTVSAHVSSCPNHQTLRDTSIETRFNVAAFGVLGYECNLCDMGSEDLTAIRAQIELYKKWRDVLQFGTFIRGRVAGATDEVLGKSFGDLTEWTCVSGDKKRAVGFIMQKLVSPNTQYASYYPRGLDPEAKYSFKNRKLKINVMEFGDLVNTVAPVHIKQGGLAHNIIAKFVKMDGEEEAYESYGDALMYGGVSLKPAFSGTGYSDEVRFFRDFASRIYFMVQKSKA
ncbi:MAG: alpha-galactosidase [Lachnospiraceae bacterium]|nr:alpha-galactosidase [Lachnospiraceae bacterium]